MRAARLRFSSSSSFSPLFSFSRGTSTTGCSPLGVRPASRTVCFSATLSTVGCSSARGLSRETVGRSTASPAGCETGEEARPHLLQKLASSGMPVPQNSHCFIAFFIPPGSNSPAFCLSLMYPGKCLYLNKHLAKITYIDTVCPTLLFSGPVYHNLGNESAILFTIFRWTDR